MQLQYVHLAIGFLVQLTYVCFLQVSTPAMLLKLHYIDLLRTCRTTRRTTSNDDDDDDDNNKRQVDMLGRHCYMPTG